MSTNSRTDHGRPGERAMPDGSVFRAAFEASRTAMFLLNPADGAFLDANQAACDFYGYGPDEMTCLEAAELSLLPQLRVLEILDELDRIGSVRRNSRHRRKNGELRDVQMDVEPIVLSTGRRCLFFIIHDVTPLMDAERSLRKSEGLLRAILNSAADGIAFRDSGGVYREANPSFCAMFAQPREELLDGSFDRRRCSLPVELDRRRDDDRGPASYQITLEDAEGVRHVNVRKSPVIDRAGEYLGTVFVGRDNTALRKSEGLLRAMLESARDAIIVLDVRDVLREANPPFLRHVNRAREETVGQPLSSIFTGEDLHIELSTNRLVRETRNPANYVRHIRRTGGDVWFSVVKNAVVDPEGRCIGVVAFGRNITEQKNAEIALRNSERRLSSLIRQAPVGVFETDPAGGLVFANERMQRQTGRSQEDLSGEGWLEAIHPEDRRDFLPHWRGLARSQELDEELRLDNPDGGVLWVSIRVRAVHDAGNRVTGYLGVLGDITERKKAEAMRSDVESVVRHDLKSPLASVQNALELLELLGPLSAEQREVVIEVRALTRRMLGLIALSLDMHAIEAGGFVPKSEPIDLCAVFEGLRVELRPFIDGKGLALTVRSDRGEGPFPVLGERRLVDAIFSNLLKNAAEASPENSELTVTMRTEDCEAVVAIRNLGEVPEEVRGRFFEKYATFGKTHGTGLGTYSARLMLRSLGGRVALDVAEPGATTLVVRLPLPRAEAASEAARPQ